MKDMRFLFLKLKQYFPCVINLVNNTRMHGKDNPKNKVVEKISHIISMKFGHVMTKIIESYDPNTLLIVE